MYQALWLLAPVEAAACFATCSVAASNESRLGFSVRFSVCALERLQPIYLVVAVSVQVQGVLLQGNLSCCHSSPGSMCACMAHGLLFDGSAQAAMTVVPAALFCVALSACFSAQLSYLRFCLPA